jgi:hypothetical protein
LRANSPLNTVLNEPGVDPPRTYDWSTRPLIAAVRAPNDPRLTAAKAQGVEAALFCWFGPRTCLLTGDLIRGRFRPIALPDWAAALLRQRKVAQKPNDLDAVFVTRNGTWHCPTNIQGRLRHIRLLDDYSGLSALQGVTPHSFRRTVATEIDEVYDAEAAKNQLGHTSTTVTERHYINRKLGVPDYRAATERLAPGSASGPDTGPAK